jgi:COP9 signalosome complex subunit 2
MSDEEWNEEGGDDGDWGDGGDDEWDEAVQLDHAASSSDAPQLTTLKSSEDMSTDDAKIEVENLFYIAEGDKKRNPGTALEKFQQCYELEIAKLNEFFMRFKALTAIVLLQYQLGLRREMIANYKKLLEYASTASVSRNDSNDAVNAILNAASDDSKESSEDGSFSEELYALTLEYLKIQGGQGTQRLFFSISVKLCRKYLESKRFEKAEAILKELHGLCKKPDGSDDMSKGSQLLEVYALEVQLLSAQGKSSEVKVLFEKTRNLNAEINDPRSMSIIQECWGKTYAIEGNWDQSFKEFWEAFLQYQQIGSMRAKQCLKYVVIASMLSPNSANPFSSREAKVFESDPEISAMVKLQRAYDDNDSRQFQNILSMNQKVILNDEFIMSNLEPLLQQTRSQTLLSLIKPYTRVRLSSLSGILSIPEEDVANLLVQLILDNRIQGKIDQVNGILEIEKQSHSEKKFAAINQWISALERINIII